MLMAVGFSPTKQLTVQNKVQNKSTHEQIVHYCWVLAECVQLFPFQGSNSPKTFHQHASHPMAPQSSSCWWRVHKMVPHQQFRLSQAGSCSGLVTRYSPADTTPNDWVWGSSVAFTGVVCIGGGGEAEAQFADEVLCSRFGWKNWKKKVHTLEIWFPCSLAGKP